MDCIYQSTIHCSKVNLKCVLKCTKFPIKKANSFMIKTNFSSIEHCCKKLCGGFNKKRLNNNYTCLMFDNKFLASKKQLKLCPRDFIFLIKQEDIFD